ncbi:type I polyketide synthase [Moritella yayanosii]|uniref:Putative Omega-3 polyunsaturated fatty acid synthase PfaA n=1 Tax=Moritella yayanosii TaxID=69539 RepID=A0A330LMN8_9GAMM|nr:type I polyketide synthase [Moritella yayanosii]SQD77118.1 putative Omega-3 polyunsaturated fatty acid synthase PfaA [Moritella yayanosii]
MAKKNTTSVKHGKEVLSNDEQRLNSRLQECPIAIIGMASVFADAKNLDQFWDNIVDSVDAIIDVPSDRWNIDDHYSADKKAADKTYCKRGGFIPELDFDPMEFGLPPNILELTDIAQLLSLIVARDVLSDAGIGSDYDHDKIGITLGVGGGQKQISPLTARLQGPVLEKVLKASGIDEDDRAMIIEKFKKAYIGWEENSFPGMLGNVIAGRIANRFDFGGTNCVVDAACAGSLAAIKMAITDLLEYRSEVMISGGVCCDNSPFMYMSFSKTPAFTTNDDIRPFDDDSKGMLVGEGIGMLAFKRLEDAERDGDRIYSVLKGIGTSSDGRFKSIYAPRPDGQAKALKRAYEDAGFAPETCGLIEGHGTGTKAGDAAEFGGLTQHFGAASDKKQHIALGSVKSQIGHTKAAAGSAGMIKAALALHHKILPATIHIDKPSEALDIKNSPMYLNSETRPWMPREDGMPRRAGISSFGFGGTNFHIVLEEYRPSHNSAYRLNSVSQTVLISATNQQGIIAELNNWRTKLAVEADLQTFAFNDLVTTWPLKTPSADQARLGFVARNANEAIVMIDAALKQFSVNADKATWSVPTGIYYRQAGIDANGKVVALFSGQGSQYVNMGRELTCNFPSMMDSATAMDKEFSTAGLGQLSAITYPIPVYTDTDRKLQEEQLRLTQHAQPAIGCLSVGLFKTFQQAGFKADFTAGHSFGELTALWAADVLSDSDYMMLARSRGQAMAAPEQQDFDAGKMAAVVGDPQQVAVIIDTIDDVSIANYNSNNQVVIAGSSEQIAVAITALGKAGFKVVPLPVSAAFHTPLVGHAQKPFAKAIDSAKFKAPTIPVFANGTGLAHSSKPSEIKKSLKKHMLESVHFNQEIDNIYADGGRIFIEFGPKNVLTKLVENILNDKADVVAIAVNANPKQPADVQMRQAALQMAVLGVALENIDPFDAVKRPLTAPKASPMVMKLSAASYVSPKTKKAFEDALTDGWTVKQAKAAPVAVPQPQVIEKIVEVEKIVERIVEVEKIVYVNADGSLASKNNNNGVNTHVNSAVVNNVINNSDADLVASIERSVGQFVQHQQQLLSVHEQFMQGPQDYAKTVQAVLAAQTNNELPESLDRTLSMYNEFQSETLRVHATYLNNQTSHMNTMLTGAEANVIATAVPVKVALNTPQQPVQTASPTTPVVNDKVVSSVVVSTVTNAVPNVANSAAVAVQTVVLAPTPALVAVVAEQQVSPATVTEAVVVPAVAVQASIDVATINKVMLDVVADKTGYPTDMLELSMDMEADLGIDSIKRVEILGAVQELIPDLPELNPEDLAELRTLGEIVDYMNAKAQAVAPATSASVTTPAVAGIDLAHIQTVMLEVVADKTGYPTDMLELSMDMEADLGIDSIKRVEILGAVQEIITDLPELNPEDLAELRTLGEIVSYMQSKAPVAASSAPDINLNHIQTVMMDVVADKTGYPTDMLELSMDMEADLGIDSIKRVEILGAVQEIITDLPELNPEDLAELRTLGEIVSYMQSKAPVAESVPAATTDAVAASSAPAIDLNHIQTVMMDVVADKTGYPTDMLELGMDMEADLGIDSIKRVEILGAVQEIITDLPELNPEDLAELRTLGEIVSYMQSKAPVAESAPAAVTASATPTIDLNHIQTVMMEVVADKTGYPVDMLELGMDMEADLGIDSIKRVEILGAVQEIITDLPELNPEDLAELRTLGEIVTYMQSKVESPIVTDSVAEVVNTTANTVVAPAIDLDRIQNVMMDVVADKTGYPANMLELAMDMEADLGIDSIKRVEILGAVQEIITDLPELNPEDLAELRTLEEIVLYMQSKAMQSKATGSADAKSAVSDAFMHDSVATITAAAEDKVEFQPAPSATVAITRLSSVTKISQDAKGANALIVADGSDSAVQLADKLIKSGWNVTALQPSWITTNSTQTFAKSVNVVTLNAVDEAEINNIITANAQLDAVIYLHASTEINHIEYPQASKQGLMLAFLLAKLSKVTQAAKVRGTFMVVTKQGGSLGFSDANSAKNDDLVKSDLVQSGLNGLVKTLSHEWDNVFCRAVDMPSSLTAEQVATIVSDELLDADTTLIEVGYQPAEKNGVERVTLTAVVTDSYALTAGNNIDANSVFLVSGGAKGVTAHCVVRIAKEYQAKFILLGRSKFSTDEPSWAQGISDEAALKKAAMQSLIAAGDKPTPMKIVQLIKPIQANREIAQTLTAITAAGGQAEYVSADVTKAANVKAAVTPVIAKFGDITGIIHGAGVLADQFIEQKTLSDFESVYSTKIDGLLSLLSVTEASNIKQLVLFSSAAGFYGNPGQSDYSIANEILNKTAYRFKSLHPQAQVLSFNWGPWDGGMVTPELKRMFDQRGVYIIPLDAGAQLLLNELAANDNRCPQILVGNDLSKDTSSDEKVDEKGTAVKKPQVSRLSDALVIKSIKATNSSSLPNSDNAKVNNSIFQVSENHFLADHMIKGNQVLPTVCAIAWMSDAAQATYSKRDCALKYVGFEDYKLFKGVVFDGNEAADYQIQLSPVTTGSEQEDVVRIAAKIFSLKSNGKPVFHYAATILLASQPLDTVKVQLQVPEFKSADEAQALYSNGTLFHGDSLQGIKQILRCDEQGLLLACQVTNVAAAKQGAFPLAANNIFANDLVYQAMLVWVRKQFNLGSLPSVTATWTVYREVAVDELFYLQLKVVEHDLLTSRGSKACCDIQLISADMQLLAEVKSAQVSVSDILNDMS